MHYAIIGVVIMISADPEMWVSCSCFCCGVPIASESYFPRNQFPKLEHGSDFACEREEKGKKGGDRGAAVVIQTCFQLTESS